MNNTCHQWLTAAIIALAVCLAPLTALAQTQASFWYFGEQAGLDFSSGSPVAINNGQVSTREGSASISDTSGNLQFYTDGITVYNSNHQIMANGIGLNGNPSSTQSGVILKKVGSASEYYIFTVNIITSTLGLQYSIVDMSLNGGLGAVTVKNTIIEQGILTERVALAKHANGTDFWLLSARGDGTQLAYQISAGGIAATPVTSTGTAFTNPFFSLADIGYMRVSPNGDTVVSAAGLTGFYDIFSFNSASGRLTKRTTITVPATEGDPARERPYGVEFSLSSDLLYLSSLRYNTKVTQYDLTVADNLIESTGVELFSGTTDSTTSTTGRVGALSLGRDGKIYVSIENETALSVIRSPNVKGLGADFAFNEISLDGRKAVLGLPNFAAFLVTPSVVIERPVDNSVTDDQTPSISGNVNPGNTVEVTITDSNGTVIQTVNPVPNAQGEWEFVATNLPEGEYVINAIATDPISRNKADATPVTFTIDLTGPDVTIVTPANGSSSGDTTPTISGTIDDDADVSVSVLNDASMVVCTGLVTPVAGMWSLDCPDLPDGDYTVTATSTDDTGNTDTDGPVSFTIDTNAPVVTITSPTQNQTIENTRPTITGTTAPNQEVEVSIDGAVVGTATADAQGNWELPLTNELSLGEHTVSATVEDETGNQGRSGDVDFVVASPNTDIVITGPTEGAELTGPEVTVTGTGTPGAAVVVTLDGQTQTTTVAPDGTWTVTFDDVQPGQPIITATSGGNSDSVTVTVITDLLLEGGGCTTAKGSSTPSGALLMLLVVLGGLFVRRRR